MTKNPTKTSDASDYARMLGNIKTRIRTAQIKATFAANRELIRLYWDIGHTIAERQEREGWGAGVIPRLARDIRNELPEVKGFSERSIKRMVQFHAEYPRLFPIGPRVVAQLDDGTMGPPSVAPSSAAELAQPISPLAVARLPIADVCAEEGQRLILQLPWAHNVLLMQKVKDLPMRHWYMRAALQNGWSRDVLTLMIDGRAHERQSKAVNNFAERLPPAQSDLARQVLKDPYIFDFLTLEEPFHEREMETQGCGDPTSLSKGTVHVYCNEKPVRLITHSFHACQTGGSLLEGPPGSQPAGHTPHPVCPM